MILWLFFPFLSVDWSLLRIIKSVGCCVCAVSCDLCAIATQEWLVLKAARWTLSASGDPQWNSVVCTLVFCGGRRQSGVLLRRRQLTLCVTVRHFPPFHKGRRQPWWKSALEFSRQKRRFVASQGKKCSHPPRATTGWTASAPFLRASEGHQTFYSFLTFTLSRLISR